MTSPRLDVGAIRAALVPLWRKPGEPVSKEPVPFPVPFVCGISGDTVRALCDRVEALEAENDALKAANERLTREHSVSHCNAVDARARVTALEAALRDLLPDLHDYANGHVAFMPEQARQRLANARAALEGEP